MSFQINEYLLPDAQLRRLQRMYTERHFLLEIRTPSLQKTILCVSGSTGNVYEVCINSAEKTMQCSCPDFHTGAECEQVLCKHCCFILYKVFRMCFKSDFFSNNSERQFTSEEVTTFERKISQIQRSRKSFDFISDALTEKYNQLKNDAKNESNNGGKRKLEVDLTAFGVVSCKDCSNLQKNDCCAVCYEELSDSTAEDLLVNCGECNKLIHKECADIWLNTGANNCVYCRSWLPYSAYVHQQENEKKSAKKPKRYTNSYLNVLNESNDTIF